MCVAIYKPNAAVLEEDDLRKCFLANRDGAGFAVTMLDPKTKKPIIYWEKGFFKFADFWKRYERYNKEFQAIVHFRIATHGSVAPKTCHPFIFEAGTHEYAYAHNGILSDFTEHAGDKYSDTMAFGDHVLKPFADANPDFITNPHLSDYIETELTGNKVIVLRADGKVKIYNEKSGKWVKGVWYSNMHWDYGTQEYGGRTRFYGSAKGWRDAYDSADYDDDYGCRTYSTWNQPTTTGGNQFWIDGIRDANTGKQLDAGGSQHYRDGYFNEIKRLKDDKAFLDGFDDGSNGSPVDGPKTSDAENSYMLGYHTAVDGLYDKYASELF